MRARLDPDVLRRFFTFPSADVPAADGAGPGALVAANGGAETEQALVCSACLAHDVNEGFGDSTSAIMVDDRLWLGSINGDCIAVVTPGTWRKQEASQLPIERLPKN